MQLVYLDEKDSKHWSLLGTVHSYALKALSVPKPCDCKTQCLSGRYVFCCKL
jgi:hypothetical protein